MPAATPIRDRILTAIQVDANGCWIWAKSTRDGYGQIILRQNGKAKNWLAHRLAYITWIGEIPNATELDHLCRVRRCVNPDHLEPVPHVVNVRRSPLVTGPTSTHGRKTHCPAGHPYDVANTYSAPSGFRNCRKCRRRANDVYRARKRTAAA